MFAIDELIEEMDVRMENLKVFFPFFQLLKVPNPYQYSLPQLAIGVLHCLLNEGSLKSQGLTHAMLGSFISEYIQKAWGEALHSEEAKEITTFVLDKMQNDGANFSFPYYSFQDQQQHTNHIKLIETRPNASYKDVVYYISNDGLDFFLKTKEFLDRAALTTQLLMLRLQLERGNFDHALNQVKDINIRLKLISSQKAEIIAYLSENTQATDRYIAYLDDIAQILNEQEELFDGCREIVDKNQEEYRSKIDRKMLSEEDKKVFTMLRVTENELKLTIEHYRQLIIINTELSNDFDRILDYKMRSALSERFDFKGVLERIIEEDRPPEVIRFMVEPLLQPNRMKQLNPLKALTPQKIFRRDKEELEEVRHEEVIELLLMDDLAEGRERHNFSIYARCLLDMLSVKERFTLQEWVDSLRFNNEDMIRNRDFIGFILALFGDKDRDDNIQILDLQKIMRVEERECSILQQAFQNHSAWMGDKIHKIVITLNPEHENIELGHGITMTNMMFEGVI
ncbi:MAG: hypothetical protein U9N81_10235 [Bacillota bacterium]|nr:hypothetical protein [Bacillota bacterium]